MKVTNDNWSQFQPAELSQHFFGQEPKANIAELSLTAAIGIIQLIQTGIDNGARGKRIVALQETDKKYAELFIIMGNKIVELQKEVSELKNLINQPK